ncbi:hypothetical protein BC629DRAFT_1444652, partial [Irpex lacteus]
ALRNRNANTAEVADVIQLGRNPSFSAPAGAAYFLTNEPTGNYIVVAALKSDGTPTYVRAVSNRGTGAHGNSTGPMHCTLRVRSSIRCSQSLAAVNMSSSDNLRRLLANSQLCCVSTQGNSGLRPERRWPYNGVNCYKVDKSLGLVPLNNTYRALNFPVVTPPTGPLDTLTQVLFNEDDSKLIAVAKDILAHPGSSRFGTSTQTVPSRELHEACPTYWRCSTDPVVGAEVVDLSGVSGNSTGNLSSSSKSSLVNVLDKARLLVTEISVDKNLKGTIVKQYQRPAGSATIDDDVATLNGKDFLYILQANATEVGVLRLDGSGKGRDIGNFDLSHSAKAAGLKISPENLVGLTTFVTAIILGDYAT